MGRQMRGLTIGFPDAILEEAAQLVKDGEFASKADVIRHWCRVGRDTSKYLFISRRYYEEALKSVGDEKTKLAERQRQFDNAERW